MTRSGLAWFSIKLGQNGVALVKVLGPTRATHLLFTGATVSFGASTVRISAGAMTLTLTRGATTQRISFHSPRFSASGRVVRGGFSIV